MYSRDLGCNGWAWAMAGLPGGVSGLPSRYHPGAELQETNYKIQRNYCHSEIAKQSAANKRCWKLTWAWTHTNKQRIIFKANTVAMPTVHASGQTLSYHSKSILFLFHVLAAPCKRHWFLCCPFARGGTCPCHASPRSEGGRPLRVHQCICTYIHSHKYIDVYIRMFSVDACVCVLVLVFLFLPFAISSSSGSPCEGHV